MKKLIQSVCVLLSIMACNLQAGVTFSGIDGAVTWVWVEGESYTTNPAPGWDMSSGGPGMSGNNNDARVCGVATAFDCPGIVWNFTAPATMNNAKMYAKCSEYFPHASRPFSINKSGLLQGYIGSTQGDWGIWKNGEYWVESTYDSGTTSLGTFNQGDVTLTLAQTVYNAMAFDGFFITNEAIDLSEANMPRTAVGSDGTSWMQRPTFTSLPTLNGPITVTVSGAPTNAEYYVNGVKQPYPMFNRLVENGTYHLEVRDGATRTICGASFILQVPAWMSELTRGHRILVEKGFHIFGFVKMDGFSGPINTQTFANSNLTGITYYPYRPSAWMDSTSYWGKLNAQDVDLVSAERDYMDYLIDLQFADAQDITAPATIQALKDKFARNRQCHPDVIGHENQDYTAYTFDEIKAFVVEAKPDMVMVDAYEFKITWPGGSPTDYYNCLAMFRRVGKDGLDGTGTQPIPYAQYLQAIPWSPSGNPPKHTPSESEIRLNQFAGWTLGYKFASAYTYIDSGCQSMLFSTFGDSNPTNQFTQMATTNAMSRKLGPALVRLFSTDVRLRVGEHYDHTESHKVWDFWPLFYHYEYEDIYVPNTQPEEIGDWNPGVDPYIVDIIAQNLGTYNNGHRGDIVLGSFKPLHESFDGPNHYDQKYFMITNGLTDSVGSAYGCRQAITVDFNFGSSGITGLQRMRRNDGIVENIVAGGCYSGLTFTYLGGTSYRMVLSLDGGTGDLFKYNTGAPFVGTSGLP